MEEKNTSKRARIKVPLGAVDYFLEILALGILLLNFILLILWFEQLPEEIPLHYGFDGQASNYGSKDNLWILAGLNLFLYLGLSLLNRYPHHWNFPFPVKEENAAQLYREGARLIRFIKVLTVSIFLFSKKELFFSWELPLLFIIGLHVLAIFVVLIVFMVRIFRYA